MKKTVFALTVLALWSATFAGASSRDNVNSQPEAKAASAQPGATPDDLSATQACSYSFASGSGNSYMGFCVSANGNIVSIQTPQGHEHIAVPGANIAEGYGICDTRPEGIAYNDWAWFATSNWGIPTLMSKTATSVEIGRITGDGLFILKQTISRVPGTSSIKIVMTLTNNSGSAAPVYLVRFADVSADGRFLNNLDSTKNSVAAWNTTGSANPYGLVLQNVGTPNVLTWNGFAQNTSLPPNSCVPWANYTGAPLVGVNGSVVMGYAISIPANGSRTVTMTYKGF